MKKSSFWLASLWLSLLIAPIQAMGLSTHLDQGNDSYSRGEFTQAYAYYMAAFNSGENKIMARFNMANCLYQLRQVGRALASYEQLIQDAPTFVRPYINAAGIYFSMDEIGNAMQLYGRALTIDPRNTTALKMMGECWLKLNDRASALESFEKGLNQEPENSGWYYAMVDVYLGMNDYQSAREILLRAIRETGENPQFLFYLAEMEIALEDWTNASSHLQQGLELNPEQRDGWTRLAFVHEMTGNAYLAVLALKEGLNGGYLDGKSWIECGRLLLSTGEQSQAFECYRQAALKGFSGAKEGMLLVAWKTRESGNNRKALEFLRIASQLYPGDSDVIETLSEFQS